MQRGRTHSLPTIQVSVPVVQSVLSKETAELLSAVEKLRKETDAITCTCRRPDCPFSNHYESPKKSPPSPPLLIQVPGRRRSDGTIVEYEGTAIYKQRMMKSGLFNFFLSQSNHPLCSLEEIEDCKVDQDNTYNTSNADYKFSRRVWQRKIVKGPKCERHHSLGSSTLSIPETLKKDPLLKKRCTRSYSAPSSKYQQKTRPQTDNSSKDNLYDKAKTGNHVVCPAVPVQCQE